MQRTGRGLALCAAAGSGPLARRFGNGRVNAWEEVVEKVWMGCWFGATKAAVRVGAELEWLQHCSLHMRSQGETQHSCNILQE